MTTTVKRVTEALEREGLRRYVDAVERGNDGEVIIWNGNGHPVNSVREAIRLAREIKADCGN